MKAIPVRDDRRDTPAAGRRFADDVRYWLPIILSLATTLIAMGTIYGRQGGRLDLIEYRLMMIENSLTTSRAR